MTDTTWLIPVSSSSATVTAVKQVLTDHGIHHVTLTEVPRSADYPGFARVGVIIGGSVSPAVLDALRWLTGTSTPTLVIAEEVSDHDEAILLSAGALDVLAIPTSEARLNSRLLALHRNAGAVGGLAVPTRGRLRVGELTIDLARREVHVGPNPISLTKTEFNLLATFAREPRRVFSRAELRRIFAASGHSSGSLESHLSRTRRKIREAGGGPVIEVLRGVGYRMGDFDIAQEPT